MLDLRLHEKEMLRRMRLLQLLEEKPHPLSVIDSIDEDAEKDDRPINSKTKEVEKKERGRGCGAKSSAAKRLYKDDQGTEKQGHAHE